jgi:CRP/FNR family transcriptional regulator
VIKSLIQVKKWIFFMDIVSLLEKTDFFKEFSSSGKTRLAGICQPRKIKKREILFLEGEKGEALCLLAEGNIQLYKTAEDGKEVAIKLIRPGEIFAEVVLFEKETYPVSATALENSLVLEFPKRKFLALLNEEGLRNDFIGMLMRKQRYLVGQIMNLSTADVESRFFMFLKEQYGQKEQYTLSLSKKNLAAAIGTNPETLSRLLFRLKEQGTLTWEGDCLALRKNFWQDR